MGHLRAAREWQNACDQGTHPASEWCVLEQMHNACGLAQMPPLTVADALMSGSFSAWHLRTHLSKGRGARGPGAHRGVQGGGYPLMPQVYLQGGAHEQVSQE
jgi:hypothetical protein